MPTSLQIKTTDSDLVDVQSSPVWLNSGTQFTIESITWQNVDVKPEDRTVYFVYEPLNLTIHCRVFDATLLIQDPLGEPISGAHLFVTLANQTTTETFSGDNGAVVLKLIPNGAFNASVTYQGQTTVVTGDASTQETVTHVISPSPSPGASSTPLVPEFQGAALAVVLFIVISTLALIHRRKTWHHS
jgi:hypothetical protein